MDVYLASQAGFIKQNEAEIGDLSNLFVLESFFYSSDETRWLIPRVKKFMLDSGAFTFLKGKHGNIDWNGYTERYAEFVNENNVELFFELDIDAVVGYDNVLKLRSKLEALTGKKPIPVWHYSRGKEEFLRMCDGYPYVALGGLVNADVSKGRYFKFMPWFVNEAHKRGCKIHGLGFTGGENLDRVKFDSVDSTSWDSVRFGCVWVFDGSKMVSVKQPGMRLKDYKSVKAHNFDEWVKFQKYAESNL